MAGLLILCFYGFQDLLHSAWPKTASANGHMEQEDLLPAMTTSRPCFSVEALQRKWVGSDTGWNYLG